MALELEQGKVFIGGVSWDTTEDRLLEYFSKFGDVQEALIMKDRNTGRSRGFGFVIYANSADADTVVQFRHNIDGKLVEAKKAVPKDELQALRNNNSSPVSPLQASTKKIFVGGLGSSVTERDFKDYFEQFGKLADAVIMYDQATQRPRGFGFVTYESEDVVERVMQRTFHELKGKTVEVKRAVPRDSSASLPKDTSIGLNMPSAPVREGRFGPGCIQDMMYLEQPRLGISSSQITMSSGTPPFYNACGSFPPIHCMGTNPLRPAISCGPPTHCMGTIPLRPAISSGLFRASHGNANVPYPMHGGHDHPINRRMDSNPLGPAISSGHFRTGHGDSNLPYSIHGGLDHAIHKRMDSNPPMEHDIWRNEGISCGSREPFNTFLEPGNSNIWSNVSLLPRRSDSFNEWRGCKESGRRYNESYEPGRYSPFYDHRAKLFEVAGNRVDIDSSLHTNSILDTRRELNGYGNFKMETMSPELNFSVPSDHARRAKQDYANHFTYHEFPDRYINIGRPRTSLVN